MDDIQFCDPSQQKEPLRKRQRIDVPRETYDGSKPVTEWQRTVDFCLANSVPLAVGAGGLALLAHEIISRASDNGDCTTADIFAKEVWSKTSEKDNAQDVGQRMWLILALSYAFVLKEKLKKAKANEEDALKEKLGKALRCPDLRSAFPTEVCRGARIVHAVINKLVVSVGLTPAKATALVITHGPHRPDHYRKLTTASQSYLLDRLPAVPFDYDDKRDRICLANMLNQLDPSLCVGDVHYDLGYRFNCTTCYPEPASASNANTAVGKEERGTPLHEDRPPTDNRLDLSYILNHNSDDSSCASRAVRNGKERLHTTYPLSSPMSSRNDPFTELLYYITVYFERHCEIMELDDQGSILAPGGAKLNNNLCSSFDSYCFTATMFAKKGLGKEFLAILGTASSLVEQILRAEHPRTLACFFEVFIHFNQTGFSEVTSIFRRYVRDMSARVFRDGHPWQRICWLLGQLDSASLQYTMAEAWRRMTDIFVGILGTTCPLAVSAHLDYIKRVFGVTNSTEEEDLLQKLLAELGDSPHFSTPRVLLNLAHSRNKRGDYPRAREQATVVLTMLREHKMYAGRTDEKIESLKIIAHSFYHQQIKAEADQTLQEAIAEIMVQYGPQHPWFTEFKSVREGWLREWGCEQQADITRRELTVLTMDENATQTIAKPEPASLLGRHTQTALVI